MSSPDNIVRKRDDGDASKHDTPIIHRLDRHDRKHGEEADDGLLDQVQHSKSVDWDAENTERELALRQRVPTDLSPKHAGDGDGVCESAGAGKQSHNRIECGRRTEVEECEDNGD